MYMHIHSLNYFDILNTIILVRTVSKCLEKDLENIKVVQITKKHLFKNKCKFDCKIINNSH